MKIPKSFGLLALSGAGGYLAIWLFSSYMNLGGPKRSVASGAEGAPQWACPLGIQHLCFPTSLTINDWATWSSAVFTGLAILGAAAIAVWQLRTQHEHALDIQRQYSATEDRRVKDQEADRQAAECARVLFKFSGVLATLVYFDAMLEEGKRRDKEAPLYLLLPANPITFRDMPRVGRLSFLIDAAGMDVLEFLQQIDIETQEWVGMGESRSRFYLRARAPVLAKHRRTKHRPPFSEWPELIGEENIDQLKRATTALDQKTKSLLSQLRRDLPVLRERFCQAYPRAKFHVIQNDAPRFIPPLAKTRPQAMKTAPK